MNTLHVAILRSLKWIMYSEEVQSVTGRGAGGTRFADPAGAGIGTSRANVGVDRVSAAKIPKFADRAAAKVRGSFVLRAAYCVLRTAYCVSQYWGWWQCWPGYYVL